ncbi:MAG: SHOCT domain-containing protein [Actinomycetota bacterium]|nr:SHOCT domain-containing protein [Actinomycetota bacterium]
MGAGGWIFMALGNIIIWGLIVAFIVWLARDLRTRPHRHHITSGASSSETLDRRLASGEISSEQYQQLRTILTTKPSDSLRATRSAAEAAA